LYNWNLGRKKGISAQTILAVPRKAVKGIKDFNTRATGEHYLVQAESDMTWTSQAIMNFYLDMVHLN
jgi:hypothetical protein